MKTETRIDNKTETQIEKMLSMLNESDIHQKFFQSFEKELRKDIEDEERLQLILRMGKLTALKMVLQEIKKQA